MISIVVAIGTDGQIGNGGQIPWNVPADLRKFREITSYKPVIMGKNTYLSLGRDLLKNRHIIVLSKTMDNFYFTDWKGSTAQNVRSVEEALNLAAAFDEEIIIAGGAEIYRELLPVVDKIYLSKIPYSGDADTYFNYPIDKFVTTQIGQYEDFDFEVLERIR